MERAEGAEGTGEREEVEGSLNGLCSYREI